VFVLKDDYPVGPVKIRAFEPFPFAGCRIQRLFVKTIVSGGVQTGQIDNVCGRARAIFALVADTEYFHLLSRYGMRHPVRDTAVSRTYSLKDYHAL